MASHPKTVVVFLSPAFSILLRILALQSTTKKSLSVGGEVFDA